MGFIIVLFILAITAVPSSAHSQVTESNPAANAVLKNAPKKIEITFSESVSTDLGGIKLFDEQGDKITISPTRTRSNIISAELPRLSPGTYIVSYQVISEDTHPIKGAYIFSVQSDLKTDIVGEREFDQIFSNSRDSVFTISETLNRFLLFSALALFIACFLLDIFGVLSLSSIPRKTIVILGILCIATSLVSIVFYSAQARDVSFFKALSISFLRDDLSTRFSFVAIIRSVLCAVILAISRYRTLMTRWLTVLLNILLALSLSVSGHAISGDLVFFAVLFDLIHIIAASLWFGGLLIFSILWNKLKDQINLNRFSQIAQLCVVAIIVSGIFAWWRQIGSYGAMTQTIFGKLVIFKIVSVICLVAIAYFTRRSVRAKEQTQEISRRTLHLIQTETIVIIFVMVATSVLINTIPARSAFNQPISKQMKVNTGYIDMTIDPSRSGPVDIHIYLLDKNQSPYPLSAHINTLQADIISVTITNEERQIIKIPITMKFQSLNHFVSIGASIPFPGKWTVSVDILVSEFDTIHAETQLTVH